MAGQWRIPDKLAGLLGKGPRRRDRRRPNDGDPRDYAWALQNIKTLGYELARLTASARLPPPPGLPVATELGSKLCTQADIESAWVAFWCADCGVQPIYNRKLWEFCYTAQALWQHGMLAAGRMGLGFGCGREPLPSVFAKYGCDILASDVPVTAPDAYKWVGVAAPTVGRPAVCYPEICPDPERLAAIRSREIDMHAIPADLDRGFDFCWSCCALEHLGSLSQGARFIEDSLAVLKPGGIAVHTTEFNLAESGETLETGDTVLFQRRHIEALAGRLAAAGHTVADLDFAAGDGLLDGFVDLPPSSQQPHLKVSISGFRCTSFGLIVKRAC